MKYDKNGRFIKSVGTRGNGPLQFSTPHAISVDAKGMVYVADRGNSRIVVLDNDLNQKAVYDNVGAPWAVCISSGPHQYLYSSNSFPTGNNFDQAPITGEVYKMELDGTVLGRFGKAGHGFKEFSSIHQMDCRNPERDVRRRDHGVPRAEDLLPAAAAVERRRRQPEAAGGCRHEAQRCKRRSSRSAARWSPSASPRRSSRSRCPRSTTTRTPTSCTLPSFGEVAGVATNSKGHVFVYARTGHAVATLGDERTFYHGGSRLFQFDQAGKFVKEIGQGVYSVNFAQQVRVDPQDNIWIVDAGSNMVVKFDPDGRLQMVLGRKPENITLRPGPGVPARLHRRRPRDVRLKHGRGGGGGRGDAGPPGAGINGDNFNRPSDVTWDRAGNIYVADGFGNNNRIAKFTKDGNFVKSWGQTGSGQGQFNQIRGIATDAAGNIYVADAGNKRIQVFDGEGTFKSQITGIGTPQAICVSGGATPVPVQLELERSREHGQRRDLQAAAQRPDRRQVRQGRQAAEGVRHGQRDRLPDGKRSAGSARSGTGARRRSR